MRWLGGLVALLFAWLSAVPALGQSNVALNCFDSSVSPPWKPCSSTNPLYVNISGGSLTVTSDATATAAAPSYTEGTVNPLSQTLVGNLRTTGVGGSFPVTAASGAIASGAVSSGAYASGALASGSIASGAMVDLVASQTPVAAATATATKGLLLGGQYDSTQKTLTTGQQAAFSASPRGAMFVAVGADGFAVTNAGTFAAQVTLPTTPLIASGNGVIAAPTSVNTGATTRASSTAAESNRVLKSSAGNLYDLDIVIGATSGYVLLFDATALPSNGAVTPVFCDRINSDGTAGGAKYAWPMPFPFATGITAGFSTTGCFTLTASATATFFGGYK